MDILNKDDAQRKLTGYITKHEGDGKDHSLPEARKTLMDLMALQGELVHKTDNTNREAKEKDTLREATMSYLNQRRDRSPSASESVNQVQPVTEAESSAATENGKPATVAPPNEPSP